MINNLRLKRLIFLFAFLFVFSLKAPFALAQSQQGITVSPSIVHLDLSKDTPEYQLTYVNTTKTGVNLLLGVSDFSELENSYRVNFLDEKDAKNYKYSLSSWVSFENKTIQLAPNEKKSVKIFIDKDRITKGGHYASILAEIVQPNTDKQVSIRAVLSSLLFVRASTGKEIEEGKISSFTPLRDGIDYPEKYILRFENSGNVHVVPYGLIEVYDPLGGLVAKGILNEGSLDALPESIRRYDTKVINYQKMLLPGVYTAKIDLHFGKTNQKLSSSVKFFSQGMFNFVKIILGLIAIIVFMLFLKRLKRNSS